MGRHPEGERKLSGAEKQARYMARLKAAASRPAPMAGGDAALLQATARELQRQQQRTGELEVENERLRADLEAASKPVTGCAFCLKTKDDVTTLIRGDKAMICNECVMHCADIIERRKAEVSRRPSCDELSAQSAIGKNN
jgi:hypothetical protein